MSLFITQTNNWKDKNYATVRNMWGLRDWTHAKIRCKHFACVRISALEEAK